MAKLYFYYSAMNAGKSTVLLQSAFNYEERGMQVLCFLPDAMVVNERPQISSRIGLSREPIVITKTDNIFEKAQKHHNISCILADEVQFFTKDHIVQLARIVDELHIPVLAYGLRTDFLGELFEGSQSLLAIADELIEIKTICFCGKKAVMTARIASDGMALSHGPQLAEKSGDVHYISLCRAHHTKSLNGERITLENPVQPL